MLEPVELDEPPEPLEPLDPEDPLELVVPEDVLVLVLVGVCELVPVAAVVVWAWLTASWMRIQAEVAMNRATAIAATRRRINEIRRRRASSLAAASWRRPSSGAGRVGRRPLPGIGRA